MAQKQRGQSFLRGFPWKAKFVTRQEIDQYFSNPEGIQCLLCGRIYGTLNWHLQIVHRTTHEKYRARYGLPWRRGLVSIKVSKRFSKVLTERIRNGSFKPEPDNKAAVAGIRSGRRRDQPFTTLAKSEMGKDQSKKNLRYGPKDFEKVLSVMLKQKITLTQVCMDKSLPSRPTVLYYGESNPSFRKKLLDTYYALPYPVQARADMFSPQFFKDLKRLKGKGLSVAEIAEKLHVSSKTVQRRLMDLR
jgi:hypothetical protein